MGGITGLLGALLGGGSDSRPTTQPSPLLYQQGVNPANAVDTPKHTASPNVFLPLNQISQPSRVEGDNTNVSDAPPKQPWELAWESHNSTAKANPLYAAALLASRRLFGG